jgi:hypothetical protein
MRKSASNAHKRGETVGHRATTQVLEEEAAGAEREGFQMVGSNRKGVVLCSLEDLNRICDSLAVLADRRENTGVIVAGSSA